MTAAEGISEPQLVRTRTYPIGYRARKWRHQPLRWRLGIIVVATVLPLFAYDLYSSYSGYISARQEITGQAMFAARTLASVIESDLRGGETALQVLGTADSLRAGDYTAFRKQAEAVIAEHFPGANLLVLRADGQQVVNTAVPPGEPLPVRKTLENQIRALQSGRPRVSDVFLGAYLGQPIITVDVPVTGKDGEKLILTLDPRLSLFDAIISRYRPDPNWFVAVVDRKGVRVARLPRGEQFAGHEMTPPVREAWSHMPEGVIETVSPEGVPTFVAFTRMTNPKWTIAVAVPKEMVTYPALWAALAQMGWNLLALVFGLALASRVSTSITVPLARLRQFAAAAKPADRDPEHALTGLPEADEVAEALLTETRQRNESHRRLIESEVRLRAIGEATPALLLAVDRQSRLVYANPATLAMLGKPAVEVLGKPASEYHNDPEEAENLRLTNLRIMATGQPETNEEQFTLPDGTRHLFLSTRAPMRDLASGGIVGVTVVSRDITEHRRAEAALAESEARFRALATATEEGVAIHDGQRIVEANEAFVRMFGFASRAEMIGSPPIEINAPEARADVLAKVAAGHAAPYETIGLRRDGSRFPIEAHGHTILYQGQRMRVGVIRDLTRQKAAEAALREGEDRWRTLAEAMPQMVWSTSSDGLVEYRNARWREFSGVDFDTGSERWRDLIHPEDRPRVEQRWAQSVRTRAAYEIEYRIRRYDGSWRHVLARALPLRDPGGEVVRWFGTLTDISDLVVAREVIAREAAQLEALAEQRGRALADSEARLAEAARMEALGRLAGGIAHDFNNVLQAIDGRINLATRLVTREPERAQGHLIRAAEAIARGAAVTGRLLSFARRGDLQAETFGPAPVLASIADVLRHTLGSTIDVRLKAEPDLPMLFADRGQLEAVLVNLANNARDAMPRGGALTLCARLRPHDSPGAPAGLKPGAYVRISVADEGEGIPPEVLARVTEPFFTTKPKGKGTGLGLAMARGFVEQSGGGLAIESVLGSGTIVSLWLPQADSLGAAAGGNEQKAPVAGVAAAASAGFRVLLAEDEPDVREVLAVELEAMGYVVGQAGDAAAAIALFDGGLRPDAVLTDLSMPGGIDGIGLIEQARRRWPRLPALLVTGHVGDVATSRLEEAERGGPFAVVRKPVVAAVLVECLSRVLAQMPVGGGTAAELRPTA